MTKYYLQAVRSDRTDPYANLAAETLLLTAAKENTAYFYLWANEPTVVIGANQNPFTECDLSAMEKGGVHLARRITGGGAVYHDEGNLNFSFVMPNALYDVKRQLSVICSALRKLGIQAEPSGRNDLTVNGAKVSGNAFYKGKTHSLHHGTLLVNADFTALSRYLTPQPQKLAKKGVSSVRARVANLSEFSRFSVPELKNALTSAFFAEYKGERNEDYSSLGVDFERNVGASDVFGLDFSDEIEKRRKYIASDKYLYEKWRAFCKKRQNQFERGFASVSFKADENGVLKSVVFETDGLYPDVVDLLERELVGKTINKTTDGFCVSGSTEDFLNTIIRDNPSVFSSEESVLTARDLTTLITEERYG